MLSYGVSNNLTKLFWMQSNMADSGDCCPQCLARPPGAQGGEMPQNSSAVFGRSLYLSRCGRGASVLEKLGWECQGGKEEAWSRMLERPFVICNVTTWQKLLGKCQSQLARSVMSAGRSGISLGPRRGRVSRPVSGPEATGSGGMHASVRLP